MPTSFNPQPLRFCPSPLNDAYLALVNNQIFPSLEVLKDGAGETLTGLKVEEHGLIFNEKADKIVEILCSVGAFVVATCKPFVYIKNKTV